MVSKFRASTRNGHLALNCSHIRMLTINYFCFRLSPRQNGCGSAHHPGRGGGLRVLDERAPVRRNLAHSVPEISIRLLCCAGSTTSSKWIICPPSYKSWRGTGLMPTRKAFTPFARRIPTCLKRRCVTTSLAPGLC